MDRKPEPRQAPKPRKKTCARCGRKLWISRDFYPSNLSWCKDCIREKNRERYRSNRKVPDGIRFDMAQGRCYDHQGRSRKLYWSSAMIEKLRRLYPFTKNESLCAEFGMGQRTIIRKARELGLQKNPEWMKEVQRANVSVAIIYNRCRGGGGQFKKGHVPHNKGKKKSHDNQPTPSKEIS